MFSVLMVTYDGESTSSLSACMESITLQTLQPDEVIICFDGDVRSELEDVVSHFKTKLPIRVFKNDKIGLARNLNVGLTHCSHDLVVRCDSDDINLPHRFATQVKMMNKKTEVCVSSGYAIEVTKNKKRVKTVPLGFIRKNSIRSFFKNPINHHSCIMRKSAVLQFGYLPGRMEDYKLWMMMLTSNHLLYNIEESLIVASADGLTSRRIGPSLRMAEIELMKINLKRSLVLGVFLAPIAFLIRFPLRFNLLHSLLKIALNTTRKRAS
jgi:amylovoran biosynthesis glycosyltransferase AmsE